MILKLLLIICFAILHDSYEDTNIRIDSETFKSHLISRQSRHHQAQLTRHKRSSPKKDFYFDYIFLQQSSQEHKSRRVIRDTVHHHPDDDDDDEHAGHSDKELIDQSDDDVQDDLLTWATLYFEILFNATNQTDCRDFEGYENRHPRLLGTAKDGERCGYINGSQELVNCAAFEDEMCQQPTFLFCAPSKEDHTLKFCRKSLLLTDFEHLLVFKNTDNATGCLVSYNKSSDIPIQLQGDLHYRERCDPASLSHEFRCKWYTQALKYDNHTNGDRSSCLKPTHLYCDPLLKVCLCGKDQDPNQFQNEEESHKCYIRPTYDFVEGYECAPGTHPEDVGKMKGKGPLKICKCNDKFYGPYFNSTDPNWWKCSASSTSPSALSLLISAIVTMLKF